MDNNRLADKGIDALTKAAGSEGSIASGRLIAGVIVAVGMFGAVGVAMRPIYRRAFAANAAAELATKGARAGGKMSETELRAALERLDTLQAWHRERHPMWYGDLPPAQAGAREAADGGTPMR